MRVAVARHRGGSVARGAGGVGVISRLTGQLTHVGESSAEIAVGGVCYEVLLPASALGCLEGRRDEEVTLFTLQYLEGNPAGSHLIPRLIGFPSEPERAFFELYTKVKGVSMRRALRTMSIPVHQLAAAIENGDERLLTSLPEIGKKTASQIVAELRGKLTAFLAPEAVTKPVKELTGASQVALEILVQWGDRRADAQRWIAAALEHDPDLNEPDAIVRAAYRVKTRDGA
ncbi:MAG: hypothetical protein D6744_16580 [Planctomycetota bacterium]|nr:MAG: hypothetical protein D6744_16580 [Planctomycetota bacterium]